MGSCFLSLTLTAFRGLVEEFPGREKEIHRHRENVLALQGESGVLSTSRPGNSLNVGEKKPGLLACNATGGIKIPDKYAWLISLEIEF